MIQVKRILCPVDFSDQSRLALRHIQLGSYGSCDNCGQPIAPKRLAAMPDVVFCVDCARANPSAKELFGQMPSSKGELTVQLEMRT